MLMPETTTCKTCKSDFTAKNIPKLPSNICPKCQGYYIAEVNKASKEDNPKNTNTGFSAPFYLSDNKRITLSLPSGTATGVSPDNHPFSLIEIYKDIEIKVYNFEKRIDTIEKNKIKEFKRQDVYEVHKSIERLEQKIALLESNMPFPLRRLEVLAFLLATLNIILTVLYLFY